MFDNTSKLGAKKMISCGLPSSRVSLDLVMYPADLLNTYHAPDPVPGTIYKKINRNSWSQAAYNLVVGPRG